MGFFGRSACIISSGKAEYKFWFHGSRFVLLRDSVIIRPAYWDLDTSSSLGIWSPCHKNGVSSNTAVKRVVKALELRKQRWASRAFKISCRDSSSSTGKRALTGKSYMAICSRTASKSSWGRESITKQGNPGLQYCKPLEHKFIRSELYGVDNSMPASPLPSTLSQPCSHS